MWFIIAIASFFLLALAAVIDKFLLSKAKVVPITYAFYVAVLGGLASSFLLFFDGNFYFPKSFLPILIVGGVAFYFALYLMFLAVQAAEVSKVNPLIVSLTPLGIFFLSLLLTLETVTFGKLIGSLLLIIGGYGLSQIGLARTRLSRKVWLLVILAAACFALTNTFGKIAYQHLPFLTAFIWLRWLALAAALLFTVFSGRLLLIFHSQKSQEATSRQKWLALAIGQTAGALGVILMQYAINLGNVMLVTSLNGIQFFFIIFLVYLLSKFYPRILQENISRRFIRQKVFWSAVLFAGVALVLI